MNEIPVLDHGYVRLVESWGKDETIIEAARMSTNKGFEGWEKDAKLLKFLWDHGHTSPFEQCGVTVEVQAPIMVFREWHRHRTQSYNEHSARYSQLPNLHYLPEPSRVRGQSKTNKQGTGPEELPPEVVAEFLRRVEEEQQRVYETYQWALDHGVAKEVARINTPVSRYSKMRASANLLNWLRFLELRMGEAAQWEIRQYANAVGEIVKGLFPRTWTLFQEKRQRTQ